MKEKIIKILQEREYYNELYRPFFPAIAEQFKPLINQEVERRIAERMPSEEWNYCPYCGMDWVKDSDAFGCWCCGKSRSRLTQKTEGGEG